MGKSFNAARDSLRIAALHPFRIFRTIHVYLSTGFPASFKWRWGAGNHFWQLHPLKSHQLFIIKGLKNQTQSPGVLIY